jgi:hypothetical protein
VVAPRTGRGRRLALVLAGAGGAVLLASASSPWVQPAHVPWPSYADGVPDFMSHPSDDLFRVGAAAVGAAALGLVAVARTRLWTSPAWALLPLLGLAGIALGLAGFESVAGYPGFGSKIANDMTLEGFHHGALNYLELGGAALLSASPLAAVRAQRRRQ